MPERQIINKGGLIRSRWFLVAVGVVIIFLGIGFFRAYYQNYQIKQEILRLQEEAARLEAKKLATLQMMQYVKSSSFIEEKARTELSMIRAGEKMVIFNSPSAVKTKELGQNKEEVLQLLPQNNAVKWWRYFFDNEL